MSECVFCKIISGEIEAQKVYEDRHTLVILDHRPLLKGHCLVMPKTHVHTLADLQDEDTGPLFVLVKRLSQAVQTALDADGSFVAVNNRISQSVPHLHVHVVPRWHKDGLFSKVLLWRRFPYKTAEEAATICARIQSAMRD
jgi:histidine triad (HIT) family protein